MTRQIQTFLLFVASLACFSVLTVWYLMPVASGADPVPGPAPLPAASLFAAAREIPSLPRTGSPSPAAWTAAAAGTPPVAVPPRHPACPASTFTHASTVAVVDMQFLLDSYPGADKHRQIRGRNQHLEEITGAIREYAIAQGLSLVLDSSGRSLHDVWLAPGLNEALDITPEIRQKLRH